MMWNPRIEAMPYDKLPDLQYKELRTLANNLYSFNKFYHDTREAANVTSMDVNSLADIVKLPFMYKQGLRDNYLGKMFTVPKNKIVRYHVSSGSRRWSPTRGTTSSIGPRRPAEASPPQASYGYGFFTGGLGATMLPASTGNVGGIWR